MASLERDCVPSPCLIARQSYRGLRFHHPEFAVLREDVMNCGSVGFCGVCYSHCCMQVRIPKMANDMQRFVETYRYGRWIGHVTQDFDFRNFLKGLGWFAHSSCKDIAKDLRAFNFAAGVPLVRFWRLD